MLAFLGLMVGPKTYKLYESFDIDGDYKNAVVKMGGDLYFTCPTRFLARYKNIIPTLQLNIDHHRFNHNIGLITLA